MSRAHHHVHHDTLAYFFGKFAEQLIARAQRDKPLWHHYQRWITLAHTSAELELVCTGLEELGAVKLVARPERGQFYLAGVHRHFEALVLLGFEPTTHRLSGLSIAEFKGTHAAAIDFLRELSWSVSTSDPKRLH